MTHHTLFTPIKLGDIELKNRIAMAPLTRNRAGDKNVPTDLNVKYYKQRATAGVIVTEATQISPQGVGYPATPGIHSAAQIEGWKKVTDAVHSAGGKILLQLWHVGRISHPDLQPENAQPVAPSAIKPEGDAITYEGPKPFEMPRALEADEIKATVTEYAKAAANAMEAGFDGVEIHAANGYLIDQFLRDKTNTRTDAYGGTPEKRLQFLKEVLEAVLKVTGPGKTGIRLSPENTFNDIDDSDPLGTFKRIAGFLAGYNLAYLHVVEGDFATGEANIDYNAIRDAFGGNYMANAGYDKPRAEKVLAEHKADLFSFGKLFIANPDLVERFKIDAPLNEPDEETFYGGDEKGYTDYPTLNQ